MKFYKEIQFCRNCKARFISENSRMRRYYCDACQKKYQQQTEV